MTKRPTQRLEAATVRGLLVPGRHADGEGLYLVVDASGAKRWVFLFRWQGKLKEMGLGGLRVVGKREAVSLAKAREKAADAREVLASGLNPIEVAKAFREVPTFGAMADEVVATLSKQWRNDKHIAGWKMTLTTHAEPIRAKRVNEITTEDVLTVLKPLADSRPETASRLRGRIERVLDAAKAKGFRVGENPARWRGHLDHLMAKRQKLSRGHHAALGFAEVPAFVADLRDRDAVAALALEFLILTAARSNEVIGARWDEIDLTGKVWTVPAGRMKAGREHRVPLCARAITILQKAAKSRAKLKDGSPGAYIFPTAGKDAPLSTNALRALLIRMEVDATAHGFRSSFRDWAGEVSNYPREIAEAALAHNVGDATERAYRRGDALEKRRKLMAAWATYIEFGGARSGNVRPMRGAA
jgi:integrase